MYQVTHPSRSEFVAIRDQRYHVRLWGQPDGERPPLFMVHGWMDVAASFQFVVDAMRQERCIVAPDWRGFGHTRALTHTDHPHPAVYGSGDHYQFADYLADLDFLIDHYNAQWGRGDAPIDLIGHSMGGNVVMLYAGVRPQRVRRLVNLEGFGMPSTRPAQAPRRYARWMDELKSLHQGTLTLKTYDDVGGVARRLMKTNQRLDANKAEWLAGHWSAPNDEGQWEILGDPAHKTVSAQLYRVDEVLEIYRCITAPVLAVEATDNHMSQWWKDSYTLDEYHQRLQSVPDVRTAVVNDAGHMLHHDQPHEVARLIEDFLG